MIGPVKVVADGFFILRFLSGVFPYRRVKATGGRECCDG
jgi:hypothetical protein